MKPIPLNLETESVVRRVIWFEEPAEALSDPIRFMAYAMASATHEDMMVLRRYVSGCGFPRGARKCTPGILNRVQFEIHCRATWLVNGAAYMGIFPKALSGLMLRVDHERWGQSQADLRQSSLGAGHARSRERFLALHDITQGACATEVAERTGRHPQTVMGWLHSYNEHGPEALLYQRTGGRPPFAQRLRLPSVTRSAPLSSKPPVHR